MPLDSHEFENKILQTLLSAANMQEPVNNERWQNYMKTSLITLGIDASTQRNVAKQGYDEIKSLNLNEQIQVFTAIFRQSQIFEIKSQCVLFLDQRKKRILTIEHWPLIKDWVKYVDNWAHSDGLSSVYTTLLQNHLAIIYPQLQKWNISKSQWERRQSVVCLFLYSRTRKNFLSYDQSIILISNLLDDKAYYVQKGVGWALREASHVYYDFTFDFIVQHINQIKPAAYSAAIEKLNPNHKEQIKFLRKKKSTF